MANINNQNEVKGMLNKVFYSTGLVCAKIKKFPNSAGWKKVSAEAKNAYETTKEKTEEIVEDIKENISSMSQSLKNGIQKAKEADSYQEVPSGVSVTVNEELTGAARKAKPSPKKAGGDTKIRRGSPSGRASAPAGPDVQKKPSAVIIDDLEKEIEKIDKELAEV